MDYQSSIQVRPPKGGGIC